VSGTAVERDTYLTGRLIPPGQWFDGLPLVAQHWDEHLGWMRQHWQPGQHIANVGPTGEGKTTYNVGLLNIRKYPLTLDPKGKDETLTASGWARVQSVPPPGGFPLLPAWWREQHYRWLTKDGRRWEEIYRRIEAGQRAPVIVGGDASSDAEDAALVALMGAAIRFARHSRGWTLHVDEFELLSSARMYRLGPPVERMLISARAARTSVVTSFQAPAWVSKHALRQAKYAVMYSTGSRAMIKNVAEDMGRDWRQLAEAVDELPRFFCLVVPRGPHGGPMMLIHPPKVG
jgi:hypothetical protein